MPFPASPAPSWYIWVNDSNDRNGIYYVAGSGVGGTGGITDPRQATYEADPYNWTFFTYSDGFGAWRRHEGGRIDQVGVSLAQLLDRIDNYEAQLAARNIPVSHEWGQVFGTTTSQRRGLTSLG